MPDSENWGLLPDVKVKLRSDELQRLAKVQRMNESVIKHHRNNTLKVHPAPIRREPKLNWCRTSRETIDADPQLGVGLLVLQSKMIESGHRLALN